MRKQKSESPSISDAEWILMSIIWDRKETTANDLIEALEGRQSWKPKTIKTLLRRLSDKGVLGYEKVGREYVFHPKFEREEAERVQSQSFIQRIFDGKTVPFVARFLKDEKLSTKEIKEIKEILERKTR